MEDVKKKKPRKSIPLKWLLLIVFSLLIIFTVLYFFIKNNTPKQPIEEIESANHEEVLFSCDNSNVKSITVTPPTGDAYTLVYQDETLVLKDDVSYPIRGTIIKELLQIATVVQVEDVVIEDAEKTDLSAFGLNPAKCRAEVTYQDGTTISLSVGNLIEGDIPGYYFMWQKDTKVYRVSTEVSEVLSYDFSMLHTIPSFSFRGDLLDQIDLSGTVNMSLFYTNSGWQMTLPYPYPLDIQKTDALLANIENLAVAKYVAVADDETRKVYGLDAPLETVVLTQAASVVTAYDKDENEYTFDVPKTNHILKYGNRYDEYFFYLEYEDCVYLATYFLDGFVLSIKPEDYLLRSPINFATNDLALLTIAQKDTEVQYDISLIEQLQKNGALVTDEEGNILYDIRVSANGNTIDSESFLTWYAKLRRLSAEGFLPKAYQIPETASCKLLIKNDSFSREIAFYPYNAIYSAMSVDGVCKFYISNSALSVLDDFPQ